MVDFDCVKLCLMGVWLISTLPSSILSKEGLMQFDCAELCQKGAESSSREQIHQHMSRWSHASNGTPWFDKCTVALLSCINMIIVTCIVLSHAHLCASSWGSVIINMIWYVSYMYVMPFMQYSHLIMAWHSYTSNIHLIHMRLYKYNIIYK